MPQSEQESWRERPRCARWKWPLACPEGSLTPWLSLSCVGRLSVSGRYRNRRESDPHVLAEGNADLPDNPGGDLHTSEIASGSSFEGRIIRCDAGVSTASTQPPIACAASAPVSLTPRREREAESLPPPRIGLPSTASPDLGSVPRRGQPGALFDISHVPSCQLVPFRTTQVASDDRAQVAGPRHAWRGCRSGARAASCEKRVPSQ